MNYIKEYKFNLDSMSSSSAVISNLTKMLQDALKMTKLLFDEVVIKC